MQSEEEKYYLIDQFLKGKLSENEKSILKESFSADEFRKETEMHKLANEAIEEQYLLGIRAATKKVIKRNGTSQSGKWIAGSCIIAAGIIAYTIYTKNEINQESTPLTNQISVKSTVIQPNQPAKPSIKNRNTIKPNKINQTTNLRLPEIHPVKEKEVQEPDLLPKTSFQDVKSEILTESKPVEIFRTDVKVSSLAVILQEKKATNKEQLLSQTEAKETIDLILNPNRDELIYFPLDEDFNGELVLLDATGNMILNRHIKNGSPKEWDGTIESGGKAPSGQYLFLLKTTEGKEIKQGYITVVR